MSDNKEKKLSALITDLANKKDDDSLVIELVERCKARTPDDLHCVLFQLAIDTNGGPATLANVRERCFQARVRWFGETWSTHRKAEDVVVTVMGRSVSRRVVDAFIAALDAATVIANVTATLKRRVDEFFQ